MGSGARSRWPWLPSRGSRSGRSADAGSAPPPGPGAPPGRAVVLKRGGVDPLEAAAGLLDYEVAIPRAEAPPLPEGTYYHTDILGLQVWEGDRHLGCVREILETPAHDVYVIQGPTGEWMLPATRGHIRRVDLAAGRSGRGG